MHLQPGPGVGEHARFRSVVFRRTMTGRERRRHPTQKAMYGLEQKLTEEDSPYIGQNKLLLLQLWGRFSPEESQDR